MSATEILVIILAAALAVFLILGIVLTILLIRVTRQIQSIATSTKAVVENVERASGSVNKLLSPALVLKLFKDLTGRRQKRDNNKR